MIEEERVVPLTVSLSLQTSLPKLPTKLSNQVRNLVADFSRQRNKPSLSVLIARQNRDGSEWAAHERMRNAHTTDLPSPPFTAEVELANSLLEDQNNDAMSYVDYVSPVHAPLLPPLTPSLLQLCHVHRIITTEMSGSSGGGNTKTDDSSEHSSLWRGW